MIRLAISTSLVVSAMYALCAQVSGQQGCYQVTLTSCANCLNVGPGGPFPGAPSKCMRPTSDATEEEAREMAPSNPDNDSGRQSPCDA